MEEILASIKRVIAEDGRGPQARPERGSRPAEAPPLEPDPEPMPEEDILELDDPVSDGDDSLVSDDTAEASRQSLAALVAMREFDEHAPIAAGDGPLEAVVRDMLRPLLKEWLDRNLPEMVEELVTREIARITGQRL